jgi:transcriptional regulator with XRE-family HTH domain
MRTAQLRQWRRLNGYSQSQLAGVLKVAPNTISRWERGDRRIPSFLHLALKAIRKPRAVSSRRAAPGSKTH